MHLLLEHQALLDDQDLLDHGDYGGVAVLADRRHRVDLAPDGHTLDFDVIAEEIGARMAGVPLHLRPHPHPARLHHSLGDDQFLLNERYYLGVMLVHPGLETKDVEPA